MSPAPESSLGNTIPGEKIQSRGGWEPPTHLDRETQVQTRSHHLPYKNKTPKCYCFCRNALRPPPLHDASDPGSVCCWAHRTPRLPSQRGLALHPGPTCVGFCFSLQPHHEDSRVRAAAGLGAGPTDRLWRHNLQAQQFCPLSLGLRASHAPFPEEDS